MVIETNVLLKVDFTCTIAESTFLFDFLVFFLYDIVIHYAQLTIVTYFFVTLRLSETAVPARRGPLRVRAFVFVRWPRTGRPFL